MEDRKPDLPLNQRLLAFASVHQRHLNTLYFNGLSDVTEGFFYVERHETADNRTLASPFTHFTK